MPTILDSYNANAETVPLYKEWDNLAIKKVLKKPPIVLQENSLVEIVEDEKQVFLKIRVGLNDQEIIKDIIRLWSYAPNRHVTPGKQMPKRGIDLVDSYQEICDALLKLESPISYRKAEALSEEGYPVDSAVLQTVLDAAKKPEFANVVCSSTSSYITRKEKVKKEDGEEDEKENGKEKEVYVGYLVYERLNIKFNKEPWEPPVPVVESPSLPQNLFQKLRSVFSRN